MLVGGVSSSLAQLGSNLSLAREVPPHRMGLSFGVKQAAIPLGTLIAGVAVPTVGLTLGWRWAFAGAAVLALAALPLVPSDRTDRRAERARKDADVAVLPLSVVAMSATLASGAANALGAFLVDSAVDRGMDPGLAGGTLAIASAVGVLSRIGGGWLADRRSSGHMLVIAGMLVGGAVGLVLLSGASSPVAMLAGAVLGFGLGWSWPGLLNYSVVRLNPTAPAAATSISQVGVYTGGALGPVAFGALVHATSYRTSWLVAAGAMVAASGLLLVGRALVLRASRPSPRPVG